MESLKHTPHPKTGLKIDHTKREELIANLMKKKLYDSYEVCELLDISLQSLRRAIARNQIKTVRIGKRFLRIPAEEVERMLQGETLLFSVAEAALFLRVSHQTIRLLIKNGNLKAFRLAGKGPFKIAKSDIERIAQAE
jgi:excisionase family DNA binding protein